ncbi:hypothetical protein ADUPG1_005405, partial [Aduncisulcus paluster]
EKEKLERLKEAIKRKKTPRTSAKVMLMKEEETPQPIIPISINKRTFHALADTGASHCMINEEKFRELEEREDSWMENVDIELEMGDG